MLPPGKVRKRNGVSKIDTLVVRYTPFPNPPLTGAKSIAMQQEFDCRRGRYRVVAYTAFSGWGLTGEEVAKHLEGISDQWFFVRPQTVDSAIMREACG